MTNLMISLRRSPRTLLERDGYPGPGPGHLAIVMSRAGVGKTALLVGIGIDALLSGQKVLHVALDRSVDKIRDWYDDVLTELLQREKKLNDRAAVQLEMERNRHIQTYVGQSFSIERLKSTLDLLRDSMEFVPQVIIVDRLDLEAEIEPATVEALRGIAREIDSELWMACRTHREGPQAEPGHLPPPADAFEDHVDLAFRLDPQDAKIRLKVLKDNDKVVDEDLNIQLNPKTMLLTTGVFAKR
jgi:hypothetical protein